MKPTYALQSVSANEFSVEPSFFFLPFFFE